jgi:hypothetical protein
MTGRDEPIGVAMHLCIETTEGNSLCNYLYLKLIKASCFSFYLLCFSTKSVNKRAEQVLPERRGGDWHEWERGGGRERIEG